VVKLAIKITSVVFLEEHWFLIGLQHVVRHTTIAIQQMDAMLILGYLAVVHLLAAV